MTPDQIHIIFIIASLFILIVAIYCLFGKKTSSKSKSNNTKPQYYVWYKSDGSISSTDPHDRQKITDPKKQAQIEAMWDEIK
jgi:flagellar basal body-associated protein FliL